MSRLTTVMLVCASLAVGCKVDPSPRTVSEWDGRGGSPVSRAPFDGEYRLYKVPEHAKSYLDAAGPPLMSTRLKHGEDLGFRRHDKQTSAVAGARTVGLEDGHYEWVMVADANQLDPGKTATLVVVIVLSVVIVLGVLVIIAFAQTPLLD